MAWHVFNSGDTLYAAELDGNFNITKPPTSPGLVVTDGTNYATAGLAGGISYSGGGVTIDWDGGAVSALGPNLILTGGTLDSKQNFNVGTVTAIGNNITLTPSGTLSVTDDISVDSVTITGTVDGSVGVDITNSSTGSLAYAQTNLINDLGNYGGAFLGGSGAGDILFIETNATGGLQIINDVAAPIKFYINGGLPLELDGSLVAQVATLNINGSGNITNIGEGVGINSGTLISQHRGTINATGTAAVPSPPSGTAGYLVNMGTVATTLNIGTGNYPGQELLVDIRMGATAQVVTLGTTIALGTDVTSYTASVTSSTDDYLKLIWNGTVWNLLDIKRGYAV